MLESKVEMHRQKKPVRTGAMLLILLAAGPPFLAAQTQPVTRTMFESSTPEGYAAVTLATSGTVWGGPSKYTNDSATGAVAYMLLGTLKGCEFANAETDRGSKVYVRTRELGRFSDYEPQEACRKTSSSWTTSWTGLRMTHILFFDESSPSNTSEAAYNETTQAYSIDTATQFSPVSFPEGTFTTRSVAENSFAGINVGSPVSAVGSAALTYTLSGTDAGSFSIVAGTGQIRTKDGVTYDYETKDRYSVTVGAQDDSDNTDSIAVTIEIEDLGPACMAPPDFQGVPEDGSVSVSWTPLEDTAGNARVRGYQVEMRQGSNGIWGTTRTLLGREVTGTVYSNLVNSTSYQFRIRPLQAESDCEWHESELVTPQLSQQAPPDPDEHFRRVGRRPVGTSERNYRFLSPERCRHTTGGSTLDATCRYANTGPSSGTITLEFDDPSKAGCEVSLAYSSLTAGSFHDECFGAGVAVEFDTSFRLPPLPEAEEQDIPRAPRSQEEFDVLAWGRDDLIPGLGFGCLPGIPDCEFTPGQTYRIERDPDRRTIRYILGSYSYEKTEAAQGVLTFEGDDGKTFVFTLDVQPSGRMQVTVADADGNSPGWPGMPDTLLEGSSLPILLPIPPSWSAAIEIETDGAPEDWDGLEDRIPTPASPADPDDPRVDIGERLLLGEVWDSAFIGADGSDSSPLAWTPVYTKLGRNRAVWTISFSWCGEVCGSEDNISAFQRALAGTTWVFDISFLTEDSGKVKVTLQREGESPTTLRRFLDLKAGSSGTDSFPNELTLPDEAPQASGQDITEVQIAPVTTPAGIGENDIQTFLVNNVGSQPASYSPGDWLEPKDGGTQRMMVVASGQAATAGPASQALPSKVQDSIMPARLARRAELRSDQSSASLPPTPRQQSMNPALTQISVVCMQFDRDIPRRGTRYFSQPKTAEGEVQTCQKECVTAGGEAIQRCVWSCETNPSGETNTPSFGSATAGNQSYQAGTAISPLTLPAASGGDGSLAYSLAPGVPGLSFNAATRVLAGTPTAAGTYAMTYTVSDTDGDLATLNFVVTVATAQMTTVDLVVSSVTASDDTPGSGQSFDLTAATGNSGTAASAATTLRFYRSTNTTISSSDTQVGTAAVGALAAGGTGSSVLTLTAPSTAGTYYYGACVDQVTGESNSQNNCSSAVTVTVSASQMASAGFDLHADNGAPTGITFANDRFFVVDWDDDKAYAYQASGQRDAAADFALDSANGVAEGITFANDRFFAVDWNDKVYPYSAGTTDSQPSFGAAAVGATSPTRQGPPSAR